MTEENYQVALEVARSIYASADVQDWDNTYDYCQELIMMIEENNNE